MILFDKLEDALEEAKFCAEQEKRAYIVRPYHKVFKVFAKRRRGAGRGTHIEVGFKKGAIYRG